MSITDDIDALRPRIDMRRPARFRIRRLKATEVTTSWPWRVADVMRPGVFGSAQTHAAAVELVGAMAARFGQAVSILDANDRVVAYVTGGGQRAEYEARP